jgi:hypothetical protein
MAHTLANQSAPTIEVNPKEYLETLPDAKSENAKCGDGEKS